MEQQSIRFGSPDSQDIDVTYVFPSLPSFQECKKFCDRTEEESRNIAVLKDGIVQDCYKGLPDELNNAIYRTYSLHSQTLSNPITNPVKRIVPLKVHRAMRIILSALSRTPYRSTIKPALSSNDFQERRQVLSQINFRNLNLSPDALKSIAFQLGQTNALIEGKEVYTKGELAELFSNLALFLNRNTTPNLDTLNEQRDRLLELTELVYSRNQGDLTLFCFMSGPAIEHWNGFSSQSRGLIIDAKRERVIYYPYDKFFRINETPENNEDKLPRGDHVEIVEKVDGSMVSCYKYRGDTRFACKGNFDTQQSRIAEKLFRRYNTSNMDFQHFYYVFELVHPENKFPKGCNIVDYGNRQELVLVGLRDRLTNKMLPYTRVIEEARKHGFGVPKIEAKTLDEVIKLTKIEDTELEREGWVARFEDGKYIKIKFPAYMETLKTANDILKRRFVRKHYNFRERKDPGYVERLPQDIKQAALSQLQEFKGICQGLERYFDKVIRAKDKEFPQFVLGNLPQDLQNPLLSYWRKQDYQRSLERIALQIYAKKREMPIWD